MLENIFKPKESKEDTSSSVSSERFATAVSTISQGLFGSAAALGEYFFPSELIAGCCPRVRGQEREIAWNAAAEACDTERVHIVWHSTEDRVWYIAARSSELASHPHTWCPFASLLPGMKDAKDPPVCYTFYSDEAATMMTVTHDMLQIHRGTSSVVRAKAERVSRELGGAQIVEMTPDAVMGLTPAAWTSISLLEDRMRRILAILSVLVGLSVATVAFIVWFFSSMALLAQHNRLDDIRMRSEQASVKLMQAVEQLRASPMRAQIASFAELNDGLVQIGGWLKAYEIRDGVVKWKAIVPPSVTADRIKDLGGVTIESTPQGVVIGNDAMLKDPFIGKANKRR